MIQGFQQIIAAISLDRKMKHTVIYLNQLSEEKYHAVNLKKDRIRDWKLKVSIATTLKVLAILFNNHKKSAGRSVRIQMRRQKLELLG
jgi:hypothetical protein